MQVSVIHTFTYRAKAFTSYYICGVEESGSRLFPYSYSRQDDILSIVNKEKLESLFAVDYHQ